MNITKAWIICTVALFQTVTLSIAAVQTTVGPVSNPQDNSSVPTLTTNYITQPSCFDKLNNCGDYGNDACLGIFHSWALDNCPRHCGLCNTTKRCHDKEPRICSSKKDIICTNTAYKAYAEVNCQKTCYLCPGYSSVPTLTTNSITEPSCFDRLNNCGDFGNDACLGIFHSWAIDNCPRHCGLCNTTKGCYDKEPTICSSKSDVICTDAAYKAYAEVNCQKTCNLCPDYSFVPKSTTYAFTEHSCVDKLNNCSVFGDRFCSGMFYLWALDNCQRHCGLCNATVPKRCHDNQPTVCRSKGHVICTDAAFKAYAEVNCKKTCDLCPVYTTQTRNTTVPKGCYDKEPTICSSKSGVICTDVAYKAYAEVNCQKRCNLCPGHTTQTLKDCTFNGTKYPHGYQWTNGCDKNCTCDNGRFNCIDLCPRILSVFGLKCCHPEFIVRYFFPGACSYDGKTYKQDERWFDGCKFECVCKNAMIGEYKCWQVCPTYLLPDICHWNPAPQGQCCRIQECPTGYP